jgi:NAD(P)-dependent dehydrogenase (short-subunit alcohol dehydrogenase family)
VVDTNLKAVFFMTQQLAPILTRGATADWPAAVINIGSFAGGRVAGQPHYPYSAAKAGLQMLTQALAKGLAPDRINVNTVALGVFPEDSVIMRSYSDAVLGTIRQNIPAGRLGSAADIIALTQFLASRASSYITGATIPLDGGMHI